MSTGKPKTYQTEVIIIKTGSRPISVTLHWRDRRTLGLSVAPGPRVDAYAPRQAKRREVEEFIDQKKAWIARKLEQLENLQPLPRPKRYVSGESLILLGRQYRLKVIPGHRIRLEQCGPYVLVTTPDETKNGTVKRAVDRWYRRQAEDVFQNKLSAGMKIAARHGITVEPTLGIRKMTRRWGSCDSKGKIILNLHLIKMSVPCIEYVIMHELCHLKERNHNRPFYSLLSRCMPDWQQRKKELSRVLL